MGFRASAIVLALFVAGCTSGPTPIDDTESYKNEIEEQRADKDRLFLDANNPDSPIPAGKHAEMLPLSYYAVDPDYRVPAELRVSQEQPVFDMPTSTGKMRKVTQVGTLHFTVKGQPLTLLAFAGEGPGGAPDMRRLFVPFADLTTGTETYEAGRYLDVDRTATEIYLLDFNQAYNPYCAYNNTFDCPFPPAANRLKMAVTAGERVKRAPATSDSSRTPHTTSPG